VSDRGRGIAPDEREKIFEPYYRARNSRGVHGAGIGLYVARKFVENHSGTIQIHGALNAGTSVTITLPVAGPAVTEENRTDAASALHRG
jgi:signal transduction histidine kinase